MTHVDAVSSEGQVHTVIRCGRPVKIQYSVLPPVCKWVHLRMTDLFAFSHPSENMAKCS